MTWLADIHPETNQIRQLPEFGPLSMSEVILPSSQFNLTINFWVTPNITLLSIYVWPNFIEQIIVACSNLILG